MSTDITNLIQSTAPENPAVPARRDPPPNIEFNGNIYSGSQQFALAQRMAQALSASTIVPKEYQGENGFGNCLIALEMATRLNTSPLMVMQNLYVVNGRPAWSSQYIIAMINSSKKYKTELQYHMENKGDLKKMSCYAWAEDYNGHKVVGPTISMEMAQKEGWTEKNMSKWKTMPEVMIRYRAASFFGRLNCPDMIMGIYSTDEVIELGADEYRVVDAVEAEAQVTKEIAEHANKTELDITGAEEDIATEAGAAQTTLESPAATPDF